MNTFDIIREKLNTFSARSAWKRGVNEYAMELVENLEQSAIDGHFSEDNLSSAAAVSEALLGGAASWSEYSRAAVKKQGFAGRSHENIRSSSSYFSWVMSASFWVPLRRTTYVQRP